MEDPYYVRWGQLYLNGFTALGSAIWTVTEFDAVYLPLDRANRLIQAIRIIENTESLEVEKVDE